MIIKLHNFYL